MLSLAHRVSRPEWSVREENGGRCNSVGGRGAPVVDDGIEGKRNLLAEETQRYFGETCPALTARW